LKWACVSAAVHPRIRGEHTHSLRRRIVAGGSSPHTRGTRPLGPGLDACGRFIPAYAGNTGIRRPGRRRPAVHPRIRGEHWSTIVSNDWTSGSSPHTRGTRSRSRFRVRHRRFIPAYAGNTCTRRGRHTDPAVHPRIRGEHETLTDIQRAARGSSPHTRGTPVRQRRLEGGTRFIPAYAGNTLKPAFCRSRVPVHPRIRGEHIIRLHAGARRYGSSPHTRGTLPPFALT